MKAKLVALIILGLNITAFGQERISGVAFLDKNANGVFDKGEKPFEQLFISNGRDFVQTGNNGSYSIEKLDGRFVFAIKPTSFQFAMDKDFQPEFYHRKGSTFNIPLYPSKEEEKYTLVLMGDPQVYKQDQVNYLGEVTTDELLDASYNFMIVLGDIVGNSLPLLPKVKKTFGLTQKPNYYIIGNHDRDRGDFEDPTKQDNDSYEKTYGPDYYSFNWGDVHYLMLNDVLTKPNKNTNGSDYIPGIHETELEFIKNDLATVPSGKLVVVCAHIPFFIGDKKTKQTEMMIEMLKDHPKVFMATGHAHNQLQLFFGKNEGWQNEQPIHQLVAGAICGNWWRGEYDMFGIPGSMMRDGTPPGYWFMYVDGTNYQLEYKVAGRDKSKQMHIWVPEYFEMFDTLSSANPGINDIWINVYAGNEFTDVKYRIDEGTWKPAERKVEFDPYILRLLRRQELGITPTKGSRELKAEPRESTHLWHGTIPEGLNKGSHMMEVTAKNKYGLDAKANRVFWVR
ncbi:MAG TPA: calcineurin-like phosphoesterase family protein [Draconibacterium sp.]|nr:calcineurin-like phosphoesterase family protein [Draconibacterium sp.]